MNPRKKILIICIVQLWFISVFAGANRSNGESFFIINPNPVTISTQQVDFHCSSQTTRGGELRIYDGTGNIVYETEITVGAQQIPAWNLRNLQGRKITKGTYLAVLKLTRNNGSTEFFQAKIGISH